MKRLTYLLFLTTIACCIQAKEIVIMNKKTQINNWNLVDITNAKFGDIALGDTIYVYATVSDSVSTGAFINHNFKPFADDAISGNIISGDYMMIVDSEKKIEELKNYGLQISGFNYTINKVSIKKKQDSHLLMYLGIGAAILLLLLTAICIYNYVKLRRRSQQLFQLSISMLTTLENERQLHNWYEGHISALNTTIKNVLPLLPQKEKYKLISEDNKENLLNKITMVMENTEEISSADFSLNRLAELAGSSSRTVSYTINTHYKKNFNALLNEYRIREACRRMNNKEEYGNLTLEAISQTLGFKSRSNFISTFKKVIGLTPTEYMKMAKDRQADYTPYEEIENKE